jgi:hypothetical protein
MQAFHKALPFWARITLMAGLFGIGGSEAAVLVSAAHRLDSLIHHRRMMLVAEAMADPDHGMAALFAADGGEAKPLPTATADDLAH